MSARTAAWRGATETPIVPSLILIATFIGFGALARESGLSLFDALFVSVFMFALPAQVVLVDQMAHGASMLASGLAVTATGVRLLPMVVAFVPLVRDRGLPKWMEYVIAHFVAVTMWVETMRRAPSVPKRLRAAYALGIAANLMLASVAGALAGYLLAADTSPAVTAALLFMSPMYFIVAMLAGPTRATELMPILMGAVLGPVFHLVAPEFDLLLTGLVGGSVSYWASKRFKPPPEAIKSRNPATTDGNTGEAP